MKCWRELKQFRSKIQFKEALMDKILKTSFSFHVKWRITGKLQFQLLKIWDCPDISECPKILSLKSFGHSKGNSYALCSLLRSTLCCTCYDRKICSDIKWSQNITTLIVCKVFFCFLCFLLTAPIAESSHILPWISFNFL